MVGNIYFINMPYSDFTKVKGRPVLVFQSIDKNDLLILPLTSNLEREGIMITEADIQDGRLKRESVVVVPKLTAVDANLIIGSKFIASLKEDSFSKIKKELCLRLGCESEFMKKSIKEQIKNASYNVRIDNEQIMKF